MPKRSRGADGQEEPPKASKAQKPNKSDINIAAAETPSARKSVLRGTPSKLNQILDADPSPTPLKKVLFSTPSKPVQADVTTEETPLAARNDRSARRKSAKTLQRHQEAGSDSEQELDADEEQLAAAILSGGEDEESSDEPLQGQDAPSVQATPSKTGRPRGRPKGKRRERTPTPPPDLPPHELYFFQNRAGANRTSTNTLPSHMLLNRDDYNDQIKAYKDPHDADMKRLAQLHRRAYDQWTFEVEEGFNLCLYGFGSKRGILTDFATHLYLTKEPKPKIIVLNGYDPDVSLKDLLNTIAAEVLPRNTKMPAQPAALLDFILTAMPETRQERNLVLLIHSLDSTVLRKASAQSMIAHLASEPGISLMASCDNPNFGLLWDLSLKRQFNFLFHDATTFEPYGAEIDVVEGVNALLGRSSRTIGGKDGVSYVLKSLPENARNLFRILVAEQLALIAMEPAAGASHLGDFDDADELLGVSDEEEAAVQQDTPSRRGRGRPPKKAKAAKQKAVRKATDETSGVEYRTLYHKAVEEFVCSSEVNFRTLLREFHDHEMIESRKDAMGTERLVVPFRREELEAIVEEL